jgi:uncharacterized protein
MAKNKTPEPRLRLSRVDFYRLRGQEFFEALFRCVDGELGEGRQRTKRWARLNALQQGLYAWWCFWGDVFNGGLTQYFYNHTDAFSPALNALLTVSRNAPMASLLNQAAKIYQKHEKEFRVADPFGEDGLFARMTELAKLDRPVGRQMGRTNTQLEKWLRANISLIALSDAGKPIDPNFSGEIETLHLNGKVHEHAAVRRGMISGSYRRHFDDGTLEHACFYQGGKVCADYWPTGQPKHKTMKRGGLKILEWYYPSGNIQKRLVADKSGYAIEPVKLWHENGQLAEEVHLKGGNKLGPWLRFFEDGAPRLQAEYGKNKSLVVKNAWDDQRRQVVKDGHGVYFDDGRNIDVSYDLFFESDWTCSQELRDGVPHGLTTTWNAGVLWSKQEYVNGRRDGSNTLFYDNGRVRERSTYRNDEETETQEFPKFDNPRPAVLLRVEADAEIYEAWGHPLLDVYPKPRNLERVQSHLTVPAFLEEVFERNQTGQLKDDYDNLNTFDDSIAYMVMVNEQGIVDKVDFSGASAYSGGVVDIYPPAIQKLKFDPGRIGRRKVRCRVVVWVHHTFAESAPVAG